MKVRQDAWSHEDDVFLAETVLRHVREGSTQLRAFDDVGDELNRTSAACGFRWNAVVRSRYMKQMAEAKKERKERKRTTISNIYRPNQPVWNQSISMPSYQVEMKKELSIDQIIHYLQSLSHTNQSTAQIQKENEALLQQNIDLLNRNRQLEKELQKIKQDNSIVEEDYQSLIQIMNRARRMAILEDEEPLSNSTFRMDKNGNLEKVAK